MLKVQSASSNVVSSKQTQALKVVINANNLLETLENRQLFAAISGSAFLDLNSSHNQEATDAALAGVQLQLQERANNVNSNLGAPVTTDANGDYAFPAFTATVGSTYRVLVVSPLPNGFEYSLQNQNDDSVDSDFNSIGITNFQAIDDAEQVTLDLGATPIRQVLRARVWFDANGDGLQDTSELTTPPPSISGLNYELRSVGPDGLWNTADDPNLFAGNNRILGDGDDTPFITRSVGFQNVQNLFTWPADIQIWVDPASVPAGFELTSLQAGSDDTLDSDVDPITGFSRVLSIDSWLSTSPTTSIIEFIDIGLKAKAASIGDLVFDDANGNGLQDTDEAGISGVTITLYNDQGVPLANTASGTDGAYVFNGLSAGDYRVGFDLSSLVDKAFTNQNTGDPVLDDAIDSDVDPATGLTDLFTVAPGQDVTSIDAGVVSDGVIVLNGEISDRVFLDANANGLQDAGELGIAGAMVQLLDAQGSLVDTAITDVDGVYIFSNVEPNDYQLKFDFTTAPGFEIGYAFSPANADDAIPGDQSTADDTTTDSDADTTGLTSLITLAAGETRNGLAAGAVALPGSISGRVWLDTNRNSQQDPSETTGLAGLTVQLLDNSLNPVDSAITAADGSYSFSNLEAGSIYRVTVEFADLQPGTEFSLANVGDDATDSDFIAVSSPTGTYFAQDFISAGENTVFDLGVRERAATLSTRVFADTNRNGLNDDASTVFSGVTVALLGVGADGIFGTADDINVRLGPDGQAGTGDDAINTGGLDGIFGNADDATSTVLALSSTGGGAFFNLTPGSYQFFFDPSTLPSSDEELTLLQAGGLSAINDSDADPNTGFTEVFTLVAGEINNSFQAGFRLKPAQIGGRVWTDSNANGLQDAGEAGLADRTIELVDDLGNVVNTRVTDSNGDYLFEDEDPNQSYAVLFDRSIVPAGFGFTQQDAGALQDDNIDSDADPSTGDTPLVLYSPGDQSLAVSAGVSEVTGNIDIESTVFAPTVAVQRVIDFDNDTAGNPLAAGDDPSSAYSDIGLTITSARAANPPMIFDSANPTGNDWDLRTPGWHPSNQIAQGNILIISEDGDASDPDDNRRGGTLIFTFDEAVQLDSLSLLDNQSRRTKIQIFAPDGSLLRSISVPKGRNNAIQQIDLNTDNAAYMTVKLGGSGAITELTYNQAQYGNVDADTGPGPTLVTGGTAALTYTVSNTGVNALTDLLVSDELGTPDAVVDENGFNTGDTDLDGVFDPGEAWVYTRTTTVGENSNSLTATATGTPVNPFAFTGFTVNDTDATFFQGGLVPGSDGDNGVDELEPVYVLAGFTGGTQDNSAGSIESIDTWYDSVLNELGFRAEFGTVAGQLPDVFTLTFGAGSDVLTIDTTDPANPVVTATTAAGAAIASSLTDVEFIIDIEIQDTATGRVVSLALNSETLSATSFGETVDINLTTHTGSTTAYNATTGELTSLITSADGSYAATGVSTQAATAANSGAIQQRGDGVIMIDAADVDSFNSRYGSTGWSVTDAAGDTGEGSITTSNWWRRLDRHFTKRSPQATYTVNFAQAGTYYVWIRGSAPDTGSNSVHVGINGKARSSADRISLDTTDSSFAWTNDTMDGHRATITVNETGIATIDLWMREDGFTIDSIFLTQDASETPTDQGPVANLRVTPDTGLNLRLVNIGDPLLSGSVAVDENGVITLTGAGSNIGGANDAFTFAGTQVTGDFEIVAEFVDLDQAEYWTQAGLMARESLENDSAYAFALMNGGNQTAFEFREETGGSSEYDWTAQTNDKVWVKMVREGDLFTTYHSKDGTTWSAVASHTIDLLDELWLGLAIVSHDEDETASAQFGNVTINGQAIA